MDSQLHAIENQGYHRTLKGNRLSAVAGNITHDTLLRKIAKKNTQFGLGHERQWASANPRPPGSHQLKPHPNH